ncbi:RagB/SusD family nutrient uptake outer membrane protein [Pedobacter sp. B4-66]|uniref:RagB/SusD family nutrient uptake outer membrane protein n=1 Tax=Pedobacter sp. B4-66 TaxID=2817280 RepID=UPI001BDADE49|nr:RagB/SusD family nutrient uptake outer membrane protein [Pedobacter sp. B4-66]
MRNTCILILLTVVMSLYTACNKFVEPPVSKNQVERNVVFADSSLATAALLNAYFVLGTSTYIYTKNISIYTDEYTYTSALGSILEYNQSRLSADNYQNAALWNTLYSVIYQCNALMEGLEQSPGLSATAKQQLFGEALFLRAFANFYLVNFYGHVPLILTTNVNENARAFQKTQEEIDEQLIKDLQQAILLLKPQYQGHGKVRANNWTAKALLARVYLYQKRWSEAEKEASAVINCGLYSPLPKLEDTFLANSRESILQFWAQNGCVNDAAELIPSSFTELPNYAMTMGLIQAFSETDARKDKWVSVSSVTVGGITKPYHYPAKYKNREANAASPEYVMALRLSEQYLIRAEAFANQGHIADAVADLNVTRERAGLLPLPPEVSMWECLNAIAEERRLELFGEWGHRFLDLKRTGQLNAVMTALKTSWLPRAVSFPIPKTEILYNSNLIQNNDY